MKYMVCYMLGMMLFVDACCTEVVVALGNLQQNLQELSTLIKTEGKRLLTSNQKIMLSAKGTLVEGYNARYDKKNLQPDDQWADDKDACMYYNVAALRSEGIIESVEEFEATDFGEYEEADAQQLREFREKLLPLCERVQAGAEWRKKQEDASKVLQTAIDALNSVDPAVEAQNNPGDANWKIGRFADVQKYFSWNPMALIKNMVGPREPSELKDMPKAVELWKQLVKKIDTTWEKIEAQVEIEKEKKKEAEQKINPAGSATASSEPTKEPSQVEITPKPFIVDEGKKIQNIISEIEAAIKEAEKGTGSTPKVPANKEERDALRRTLIDRWLNKPGVLGVDDINRKEFYKIGTPAGAYPTFTVEGPRRATQQKTLNDLYKAIETFVLVTSRAGQ